MTKRKMQIMSPDGDYTTQLMPETDAQYVLTSDGDNVENKITVNTQQINILKESVSSGKSKVASSITGKGVHTEATATFQQMATNIDSIKLGSGNATADKVLAPFTFTNSTGIEQVGTMPNNGDVAGAIVNAVLKEGYTSGGTIANAIAENILDGVNIAGIVGVLKKKNMIIADSYQTDNGYGAEYYWGGSGTFYPKKLTIQSLDFKPLLAIALLKSGVDIRYSIFIEKTMLPQDFIYNQDALITFTGNISALKSTTPAMYRPNNYFGYIGNNLHLPTPSTASIVNPYKVIVFG